MNAVSAKRLLLAYRPGTQDASEADLRVALEFASTDPEVGAWLQHHLRTQLAIRTQLRAIPLPVGLGQEILMSEETRRRRVRVRRWRQGVTAAAAVVLLLLSLALWLDVRQNREYASYRDKMVRTALREYRMEMLSGNLEQIRDYLREHEGHSDWTLAPGLTGLQPLGCAVMRWHDQRVSLVCFDALTQGTAYLFIAKASELNGAPAGPMPKFDRIRKMSTASWTQASNTYLLAVRGEETFLRQRLRP